MAIQVWDGTKYVGAELGRFGPSGTLKEALIWDGTKYVKVWPTGPTYTWYDDFTSPTLHSRWSILGGTYSPPGLSGIYLAGPAVDATFEIDITSTGGTSVYIGAADFSSVKVTLGISSGSVSLQVGTTLAYFSGETPGVVTLRRAAGNWTALADGTPLPRDGGGIMQIADNVTGTWHLVLGADPGPTHSVGYRKL